MDPTLLRQYEDLQNELDLKRLFITPKKPENLYLEYKQKTDRLIPDLSDFDKKNIAKTISAFSNATGGIVLWGIKTRKNGGREYASSLKSIKGAHEVAERMRASLHSAVAPTNTGVRIEAVTNRQGNGYIKVLIPPGSNPPHRSLIPDDREYWVRMDGRNEKLEDFQIRDIMTRRSRPDLLMIIRGTDAVDSNQSVVDVQMRVNNQGQALAKYFGWYLTLDNADVVSTNDCRDETANNPGKSVIHYAKNDAVVHPNGMNHIVGTFRVKPREITQPMSGICTWYAEDAQLKSSPIQIIYGGDQLSSEMTLDQHF